MRLPSPDSFASASDFIASTTGFADFASANSARFSSPGFSSAVCCATGFSTGGTTTGSIRAVEMAAADSTLADSGGFATFDKIPGEPIATTTVTQEVAASKPTRVRRTARRCVPVRLRGSYFRKVGTLQACGERGALCATSADSSGIGGVWVGRADTARR